MTLWPSLFDLSTAKVKLSPLSAANLALFRFKMDKALENLDATLPMADHMTHYAQFFS